MKIFFALLLSSVIAINLWGQDLKPNQIITSVTIDTNFYDTLTFNIKWDYAWNIIKGDDGQFENIIEGETKDDTAHLFFTANCVSDHQGIHQINYCEASIKHDTIVLVFQPQYPAYASSLTVYIYNMGFWSEFWAAYPELISNESLEWKINDQKLILDKSFYDSGDTIKGFIEVKFTETSIISSGKPVSQNFFYKGFFKTKLAE